MQSYGRNTDLYGLQTGMEMLGMAAAASNSKNEAQYYQQQQNQQQSGTSSEFNNGIFVDDSSLRCLFPTQPLSLSLCNSIPTPNMVNYQHQNQNQQQDHQDGVFINMPQGFYDQQLKSRRYLIPTQELLREFCDILSSSGLNQKMIMKKKKDNNNGGGGGGGNQWVEGGCSSSSSSSWNHYNTQQQQALLQSLDILDLQRRKARLFAMLEEVKPYSFLSTFK